MYRNIHVRKFQDRSVFLINIYRISPECDQVCSDDATEGVPAEPEVRVDVDVEQQQGISCLYVNTCRNVRNRPHLAIVSVISVAGHRRA